MRVIIILALCLLSLGSDAQSALGGEIRGRSRTGSVKTVGVDSLSPNRNALLTTDSVLVALTRLMKTNDSVAKNILNEMYVLWRENITSTDNKVGTRDTVLQEVLSGGRLKVESFAPYDSVSNQAINSLAAYYGEMAVADDVATATKYLSVYDKYADFYRQIISDRSVALVAEVELNVTPNIDSIQRNTDSLNHKLNQIITRLNDSVKVWTTGGFGGSSGGGGATTIYDSTITRVSMTVTNLNSLANSATAGWGSDTVTNYRKASDYRIGVTLTMANTAPANDRAAYVYICPVYNNNGTFETAMQGTTTAPSLTQGTTTIATPNNLRLLGVLSYTTQNMILRDSWSLSEIFPIMPDAWKIVIINFTGAAVSASGNQVSYTPIFKTQR
jgi:hypothetical protein